MDRRYSSFMLAYLKEYHVHIFQEIDSAYMFDLTEIDKIAERFCDYMNISLTEMKHTRNAKCLLLRYRLVAVIVYLYQPAKISNKERLNEPLAMVIKQLLALNIPNLNTTIRNAVNLFYYVDFKKDIVQFCNLYRLLK